MWKPIGLPHDWCDDGRNDDPFIPCHSVALFPVEDVHQDHNVLGIRLAVVVEVAG